MAVLYLIRHGQAAFGNPEYDQLSSIGKRQARILGRHLSRYLPRLDALCSGGMKRQDETADLAREAMGPSPPPLHTREAFREYDHEALFRAYLPTFMADRGGTEPPGIETLLRDPKQLERALRHVLRSWIDGTGHEGPPVMGWQDFCTGAMAGVEGLLKTHGPKGRVAVFTSGGVITAVLRSLLGMSGRRALGINLSIYNGSITQVYVPSADRVGDALLLGYNNITHLELAGDKDLITFR